jgi:uncharacterized membrane protein
MLGPATTGEAWVAETAAQKADAVERVLTATSSSDTSVQQAAMKALVPVPDQSAANRLWTFLVIGLLILLGIALLGLIYLIADANDATDPDIALTAFSALFGGLIGLFAPSPAQSGSGGDAG